MLCVLCVCASEFLVCAIDVSFFQKLKDQQFFIDEVQSKNINLQNERLNLKDELAVAKSVSGNRREKRGFYDCAEKC